jgi:hypothetical protein
MGEDQPQMICFKQGAVGIVTAAGDDGKTAIIVFSAPRVRKR